MRAKKKNFFGRSRVSYVRMKKNLKHSRVSAHEKIYSKVRVHEKSLQQGSVSPVVPLFF